MLSSRDANVAEADVCRCGGALLPPAPATCPELLRCTDCGSDFFICEDPYPEAPSG